MTDCYHCGSHVNSRCAVTQEIDEKSHSFCCPGCATVATVIHESGLEVYYKKRTARPSPIDETRQSLTHTYAEIIDDPAMHQQFVAHQDDWCTTHFIVHNMHCPTCVWLIESRLNSLPGIRRANVNFRTQTLKVEWQPDQVNLSAIVTCVQHLGYGLVPYSNTALSVTIRMQHQELLKRLGVAGVFGMQIMVIAVALYASAWTSIAIAYEELFRRLSLLFILPIMFYAAAPIFTGAWRDLKQHMATMDVPIALGLSIAFVASVAATMSGTGEIYYDSIAMFVFLQLIARYLEKGAYRRMSDRITGLSAAAPGHANRLQSAHNIRSFEIIPALRLSTGDLVLIKPGEAVPADGIITSGSTSIDESLLTGESQPIQRSAGDTLFGGSINIGNAVVAQVVRPSSASALASIVKLLEDSVSDKPSNRRLTDHLAGYFSIGVVLIAIGVAVFWSTLGNTDWIAYTVAVLVVACPCALALAVPTALTATINSAARSNILIAHPDAVQSLAKANTFVFDKTGTLTQAQAHLQHTETFIDPVSTAPTILDVAISLARFSDHLICNALTRASPSIELTVENVVTTHGGGIQGTVDGKRYYFGSRAFVEAMISAPLQSTLEASEQAGLVAYLSDDIRILARFQFDNPLRDEVRQMIAQLKAMPVRLALVSGDRQFETEQIAKDLHIREVHWGCSPANKLNIIRRHQRRGERVAMVGDGINDAPTLAVADVSIAPARAQHIAKAHADILLLDDQLGLLITARRLVDFAMTIMRQNTIWAIAYNLMGISLAAAGLVPPLAAAVGMSVSSILVVGNSLRILSYQENSEK